MGEVIEWEEPPYRGVPRGVYAPFFDELRRNPGRWAVFKRGIKHPGGWAEKLRKGRFGGIDNGELEVRSVRSEDGTSTLYVRVPGKDEDDEVEGTG